MSKLRQREASQSRALQAAKIAVLEQFDNFAPLRNGLARVAKERGDWAGIPMPLANQRLVIEPTYPKGAELSTIGAPEPPVDPEAEGYTIRNTFWSMSRRGEVIIFEKDGRVDWVVRRRTHNLDMDIATADCAEAWGIEQEHHAIQLLGTLVRHHQLKRYLLTGMFMETSKRSGLTYLFRKLRPTVVLDTRGGAVRIRCTLCLHPIGYYAGSWAGVMTPTDDVVAHLMLMRGDEPMLWRRANQHPAWRPESGL